MAMAQNLAIVFVAPSSSSRASIASVSSLLASSSVRSDSSSYGNTGFLRLIKRRQSVSNLFFQTPYGYLYTHQSASPSSSFSYRRFTPVMEWQDCTVRMEVNVPASAAYNCYLDREAIPKWMPFISSVKILEDKPDLSKWSLKYKAFGRDIEFSWLARNLQPIPNRKIHWRSVEGLPNRGAVRFYPKDPSSCTVELTVSYEVPPILVPVASALQPLLRTLLSRGLERFSSFAKIYQSDKSGS